MDAILQIIAGLEAAHAVGILHRDIKPSNCFIDPSGTVKVGDFGLSISTLSRGDSALTLAGSVLGTPEFSSPEQLRGEELDLRSDIYSVGHDALLPAHGKDAVSGRKRRAAPRDGARQTRAVAAHVRPEIPEALARIVLRCLAKQAGDRFDSYDELRARAAAVHLDRADARDARAALRRGRDRSFDFHGRGHARADHALRRCSRRMTDPKLSHTPQWIWTSVALLAFEVAYFAVERRPLGRDAGQGARRPARRRPRSQCARHPAGAAPRADLHGADDGRVPALLAMPEERRN